MGRTLTAANAVIMLGVVGLFDTPQQLQGFAADDVFDAEAVDSAETMIGVDGRLSAGFIFAITKMGFTLQADSASVDFFERWYLAQQSARELYYAFGTVYLRAVEKKFTLTKGVLRNYKPFPDAKKILQPRKFMLDFEAVTPSRV